MQIKGLLIDLDGTLYTNNGPIEGAREALKRLDSAGFSYLYITNTTHKPRREVAAHLKALGLPAEEGKIFTPTIVAAKQLREEGASCYPLVEESLLDDLEGIPISDNTPDYILIGNLGEGFAYGQLNDAFRHLMAGAQLIALTKNRYWQTADGALSLDAGPFVAALEYASGRPAICIGKPDRAFFELALKGLNLPPETVAMVGDDPELDILGAQTAGLRGILVKTGRYQEGLHSPTHPDLVLQSVAQLPDALEAWEKN